VCLVHSSQFGWRVIPDLFDSGVRAGRALSKEFGCKSVDVKWEGLTVGVSCTWEEEMRLR
jgi:hypothetical protein